MSYVVGATGPGGVAYEGLAVGGDRWLWQEQAACRGIGDAPFYPGKGENSPEAQRICQRCPVRSDCLEYAMDADELYGVWGGLSAEARRQLRRQREKEATMNEELANQLAREYAAIQAQIAALTERADEVKAKMRSLAQIDVDHPSAEIKTDAGLTITLSANRRIDVRKVMSLYPVHEYTHFYKATPNAAAIKAAISPDAYESLMSIVGEPKVSLR